jgi:manganese/iron transport system ATP-binding protein
VKVVGPNGAGKSTPIKAVLGLVETEGAIRVLGRDPARARPDVAYVPQADTLDASFPVTAGEVVLMGRYRSIGWLRRVGSRPRRHRARRTADQHCSRSAWCWCRSGAPTPPT